MPPTILRRRSLESPMKCSDIMFSEYGLGGSPKPILPEVLGMEGGTLRMRLPWTGNWRFLVDYHTVNSMQENYVMYMDVSKERPGQHVIQVFVEHQYQGAFLIVL